MRKIKKVAFFIPNFGGGGAERVVVNLVNELVKNENTEIFIVCNHKSGPYTRLIESSVKVIEIKAKSTLLTFTKLHRILDSNNIDVVCSTLRSANIACGLSHLFFKFRSKWVIREANTFEEISFSFSKEYLIRQLCKLTYSKCDKIIANSNDTKESIKNVLKIRDKEIEVIDNPVIKECHPKKDRNKSTLNIINVGRLVEQKSQTDLVELAKILVDKYNFKDFIINIYGEGPNKYNINDKINTYGLTKYIKVNNFDDDIFNRYQESDIFVLTSRWEGFGNVMVEAMSCGVPVFSYNCPGGPKRIITEYCGRLIPVGDVEALAKHVIAFNNAEIEFSEESLHERARCFSVQKISKYYLDYLKN